MMEVVHFPIVGRVIAIVGLVIGGLGAIAHAGLRLTVAIAYRVKIRH